MKDILLALSGLAAGVLLMAAPYYAEGTLRAYAVYFFWGGGFVAVISLLLAASIFRRDPVDKPVAVPTLSEKNHRPTFEATRSSIIDATGATIPGDLPFQFAKADDNSVIAIPGLRVTRKDDGTMSIFSSNEPTHFPAPTGEFTSSSNSELKLRNQEICNNLLDFQGRLTKATNNFYEQCEGKLETAASKAIYDLYVSEYRTNLAQDALSLASEFLSRLDSVTLTSLSAQRGAKMVFYRTLAGLTPASDAADFLSCLEQQLPN